MKKSGGKSCYLVIVILVLFLLFSSFGMGAEIDESLEEEFDEDNEVSVIVILKDDSDYDDENMQDLEIKKEMVDEVQNEVLSDLVVKGSDVGVKDFGVQSVEDYDIEINNKFSTINAISGVVTEGGLEKLRDNPNVESVVKDGFKRITLSGSVPLVNSTSAWRLKYGGSNLTGEGETVCVIDTGVDYTHDSLGDSQVASPSYQRVTYIPIDQSVGFQIGQGISMSHRTSMDSNRLAYTMKSKIRIFQFSSGGTITLQMPENIEPYRLDLNGNLLTYFASNMSDTSFHKNGFIFLYDLRTKQTTKIAQTGGIGMLSISNGKLVYERKVDNINTPYYIYVYDILSGVEKRIGENYSTVPVVDGNSVFYSKYSGGRCNGDAVIYDMVTEDRIEVSPPNYGIPLDYKDGKVLYLGCDSEDPTYSSLTYYLYDVTTGDYETLYEGGNYDNNEASVEVVLVRNPSVSGMIEKDLIFFSKSIGGNNIIVYDMNLEKYSEINPYKISSDFDSEDNKVCFISNDRHLYCHDYSSSAVYDISSSGVFNDKIIGGYDFINNDEDPYDDHGHGTHVSGIIVSNHSTYTGVAPGASIVALKACNSGGSCPDSAILSSIDWCVNNASIFNISVISMSLGGGSFGSYCDDVLGQASYKSSIDSAVAMNISVVAATGNDYDSNNILSPACIFNSTSVGSTTKSDGVSGFSNRNSITDLFAPGSDIYSTVVGGGIDTNSGTSMATPHVSGAFVLFNQFNRNELKLNYTPQEIQDILNDTGVDVDDSGGSGLHFSRINIYGAISSLDLSGPVISVINPDNNSAVNNLSFIVNISASEILDNATLEVDNTNYTLVGKLTDWSVNISNLKNGTYTYRIYGNDTFGNGGVSGDYLINIDLMSPLWGDDKQNISTINQNSAIQINITWNDTVELDDYIFSWNNTGSWENTSGELDGKSVEVSLNKTINSSKGSVVGYQFYVNDTVGNLNSSDIFILNVVNVIPNVIEVLLSSSDGLNRTNGSLIGSFGFSDSDGDLIVGNETRWFNGSVEVIAFENLSIINSSKNIKGENWIFSARGFDGENWSNWVNSSLININNAKPVLNITNLSIELRETEVVSIILDSSDIDNDGLTYTVNSTLFELINSEYVWSTNLSQSGNYNFNITVNDTEDIDSVIVNVSVLNVEDYDGDGNPNFNDTDDDNDNIDDEDDYLIGNLSSLESSSSSGSGGGGGGGFFINLTINGSDDFRRRFNGTLKVNITNGSSLLVEFNWTFNKSNLLNLNNITINKSTNGSGAISIRGVNLRRSGLKKSAYLDKFNSTTNSICIKDSDDISYGDISSNCNGDAETLVVCNNVSNEGYTCFDLGDRYKVTGLNNSAVKELCVDKDGDGYGTGCSKGSDCNDNSYSSSNNCDTGGGDDNGEGSGGGSGGGGGGGGGSGAFFVCNKDWICSKWSSCDNGKEVRKCDFINVKQHTRNERCPSEKTKPEISKTCKIEEGSCEDSLKNQDEERVDCGGVCGECDNIIYDLDNLDKKDKKEVKEKKKETLPFTGLMLKSITEGNAVVPIFIVIILGSLFIGFKKFKKKTN